MQEVLVKRNATLEQLLALQQATERQNDASEAAATAMPTPEAALDQLAVQRSRMPAEQQETAWWLDAGTQVGHQRNSANFFHCVITQHGLGSIDGDGRGTRKQPHMFVRRLYIILWHSIVTSPSDQRTTLLMCTKAGLAEKFGIQGTMVFTARQESPLLATHAQVG